MQTLSIDCWGLFNAKTLNIETYVLCLSLFKIKLFNLIRQLKQIYIYLFIVSYFYYQFISDIVPNKIVKNFHSSTHSHHMRM